MLLRLLLKLNTVTSCVWVFLRFKVVQRHAKFTQQGVAQIFEFPHHLALQQSRKGKSEVLAIETSAEALK